MSFFIESAKEWVFGRSLLVVGTKLKMKGFDLSDNSRIFFLVSGRTSELKGKDVIEMRSFSENLHYLFF